MVGQETGNAWHLFFVNYIINSFDQGTTDTLVW